MSVSLPAIAATVALTLGGWTAPRPDASGRLHLAGGDAVGSPPVFVPYAAPSPSRAAPPDPTPPGREPPGETGAATTAQVVASLQQAPRYCGWLRNDGKGEFVIDCLAERLENVNRRMSGLQGYGAVRGVLDDTARQLNDIARANRAAGQRPTRFRTTEADGTVTRTDRRLVPVDAARQEAAVAQALAVIEEAETRLLRSAESPAARGAQFQRIAAAMGSNKVLLRSL